MKILFYVNFFSIMLDTAFRKVALSIYHKCEFFYAFIDADLGAE